MTPQELRMKRMKEAGIPMPVTQMPLSEGAASAVPVTAQNADKHARLQALKSGANKQQIQSLVKAKSMQGAGGFQGIPEPTMRKNPNQPGVASDKKVAVQNFQAEAPVSSEFSAMEAMFGGEPSAQAISMQMPTQAPMNTTQPELTVNQEGYGPDFNPAAMLAKKQASRASSEYMKYAVAPEQHAQAVQQMSAGQSQAGFDFNNMKKMMEEIARQTISEVLNEYTEKNKSKLTYESLGKSKDGSQLIQTTDGHCYKLVPVKIKR